MKTFFKKLPHSKVKLEISLSEEELEIFFKDAYQKLANEVEIPGFRKGKAPRRMILEVVGQTRLNQEILNLAIPETYYKAVKEQNLIPTQPPAIRIKAYGEKNLIYTAEFDVLPTVLLDDYRKLKVKPPSKMTKVSQKEINKVSDQIRRSKATFKEVFRPAKKGDRLEISFKGSINGIVQENLTSYNHPLILGEGVFLPSFEENLVGLRTNEEKSFSIPFPSSHHIENLKGKTVDFKVKIIKVEEIILPSLKELPTLLGQKNLNSLKRRIEEGLIEEKKYQQRLQLENEVLEKTLSLLKVELPQSLIEKELDRMIENLKSKISKLNLSLEEYLGRIKKDLNDLRKEWQGQAEKTIKIGLALREVIKREKIDFQDKEAGRKAIEKLVNYATKGS